MQNKVRQGVSGKTLKAKAARVERRIPNPDVWPCRPRTDLEIAEMCTTDGYRPARPMGIVRTVPSGVEGVPPMIVVENQPPFLLGRNAYKRLKRAAARVERAAFVERAKHRRRAVALDTRIELNSSVGVNPHA